MTDIAGKTEDALLFVGSLFSSLGPLQDSLTDLRDAFGPVLFLSDVEPWTVTDYYQEELGTPLQRRFTFFSTVVGTDGLVRAKRLTSEIELRYSCGGKRSINLDPGYLTLAKVVLASRKNYSHRIHLGDGVYAELELYCEGGHFRPLPYSYRDYRQERIIRIFNDARGRLKQILRARADSPIHAPQTQRL